MEFVPPLPRPEIADPDLTRPSALDAQPRPDSLLWIDKNENLDPDLLRFTSRLLAEIDSRALCTYPELGPLYRKLGTFLDLPPQSLLLSAGSDGAIRYVFEAYVSPGDAVIHTAPTFGMYPVYCSIYGARPIPLTYAPSASGPSLTVDAVTSAIRKIKPRLVCLPNPDSPTGTVFGPEEMESIIRTAGEEGAIILVDEAYYPFYDSSVIAWIARHKNLIVVRTFAKAWGLAGLRIGYAAACPEVAAFLHKVRPMYEVNTLAVHLVERMLDHSDAVLVSVARLNAGKRYFLGAMQTLGLRVLHGHGNFLHVAFGPKALDVFRALDDAALYRKDFKEPCLAGFSRFSATTKELFEPLVRKIEQAVGNEVAA